MPGEYKRKDMEFMDLKLLGERKSVMVKVNTELDHHAAAEIRRAVDAKIKSSNAVNVIFDFSKVDFMDSSGIGVIMGRYKLTGILGGKVVIFGARKNVKRIIEMSGIDKLITICGSADEALQAL